MRLDSTQSPMRCLIVVSALRESDGAIETARSIAALMCAFGRVKFALLF